MKNTKNWHFDKEEQRRQKLNHMLRVAAECFNEKGFSGTSLKDVSKKLGITDAALYYYVKNKEELVNLCYLRAVDLAENAFDKAESEGELALEVLQLYLRYQIEGCCGEAGPVAILSEIPALTPDHRKVIQKRTRELDSRISGLVERGVNQGQIRTSNPVATVNAIMGALNWVPKWYRSESKLTGEEIANTFIETFTLGLAPR